MRIAVTGTPGTGKTTAVDRLDTDFEVIHLNDVIREEGLHEGKDEDRDSYYTDMDAAADWLSGKDDVVVDSHLAHRFAADRVVVLRCHPEELGRRLVERGEPDAKARENSESEALDVILSEAVAEHGLDAVYEIETSELDPDDVAAEIEAVIDGRREPNAGDVSYIDYL